MRMIKLPQGEWVRMADVVTIEPTKKTDIGAGENGVNLVTSNLLVVLKNEAGIKEFNYTFEDGDFAFKVADQLAQQINSINPYGLGGIVHT